MALIPTEGILDRRHRESPLKVGYALGHNIGQAFRFHVCIRESPSDKLATVFCDHHLDPVSICRGAVNIFRKAIITRKTCLAWYKCLRVYEIFSLLREIRYSPDNIVRENVFCAELPHPCRLRFEI